jgi:NNP family nitrate/nitrite transporter-like MFS transporter
MLVAYGWQMVAVVWAAALLVTAVVFWFTTDDDPDLMRHRRSGQRPESFMEMLKQLANLQVWRFSLYYFFVFGAFVALALWLPRYLVGVYNLDIKSAGMIAAFYSVPASIFNIIDGIKLAVFVQADLGGKLFHFGCPRDTSHHAF